MDEKLLREGMFSWNELMTKDAEAAKKFYAKVLGWEYQEFPMAGMIYSVIKAKGEEIGGIMNMPPQTVGVPPHWGVYVTVDNVDEAAKKAGETGGQILSPPADIPEVGRFCIIRDPQGAVISLITYLKR